MINPGEKKHYRGYIKGRPLGKRFEGSTEDYVQAPQKNIKRKQNGRGAEKKEAESKLCLGKKSQVKNIRSGC